MIVEDPACASPVNDTQKDGIGGTRPGSSCR